MAFKCDMCGKGRMVGKQHKHHPGVAGGRWKKRAPKTQKIFRPNLHVFHAKLNGVSKKLKLCTKCLRIAKIDAKNAVNKTSSSKASQTPVATA